MDMGRYYRHSNRRSTSCLSAEVIGKGIEDGNTSLWYPNTDMTSVSNREQYSLVATRYSSKTPTSSVVLVPNLKEFELLSSRSQEIEVFFGISETKSALGTE